MKIGVLSDTHIPGRAKHLPKALLNGLKGVDLILHAGDWQDLEVYKQLNKIAPVDGVAGNVDGSEVVQRFGRKKIVNLQGYNIGIVHGNGRGKTTLRRAYDAFIGDKVDIILFGHSHIPYNKTHEGILFFNPGSATDKRRQPKYSFGMIELSEKIKAQHIFYEKRD